MDKLGNITIGVISRNGQPFIECCLQSLASSLPTLLNSFDTIDFILVDSNSSDKTLQVMLNFSDRIKGNCIRSDVYLIEGQCNSAIARNVILQKCNGDFIFLCDGDIVVDINFVLISVKKIVDGKSDAIVGQLSEKWFDSEFNCYKVVPLRKKIANDQPVRLTGGIIVLSQSVVQSGVQYDETLMRNEDRDFSLRISDSFRILGISEFVGTHLTQPYYSNERFGTFIKENYNKYLGILLRKHVFSFRSLLEIAKAEKGVMLGFVYLALIMISFVLCLLQICAPVIVVLVVIFIDFIRSIRKHPASRFIMNRFISPIMVAQGFLRPGENIRVYSVTKVN